MNTGFPLIRRRNQQVVDLVTGPETRLIAIRVMRVLGSPLIIDADAFKTQVDDYIRVFRATKPAPGTNGPLIPGDPERQAERTRRDKGVPLIPAVIEELRDISLKTGIPFD